MLRFRIGLAAIRHFWSETRGSLSVEAALILPLLTWFYVGSFVWFDAFRTQNANLKAAYTIADMLSRETVPVTETYLKGLNTVFDYLTTSNHPTYIRVTTVRCLSACALDDSRVLEVGWSYATDGRAPITTAGIVAFNDTIPIMPQGDTLVLVETFMAYEPIFNVGITATTFENKVVTRPRFAPQLLYAGANT